MTTDMNKPGPSASRESAEKQENQRSQYTNKNFLTLRKFTEYENVT